VLLVLTTACAGLVWIARGARARATPATLPDPPALPVSSEAETGLTNGTSSTAVTALRRLRWILLAFAPSSLLLGVTTYITTDIASVPLLWVIPLSAYLLTFILAFARRQFLPLPIASRVQPFFVIPVVILMFWGGQVNVTADLLLHLGAFFFTALVCHSLLAGDRPPVQHLTEFYLMISVGGALGGAFNTLVAPNVFDTIAEYPLVLALACLLRPGAATVDTPLLRGMLPVWVWFMRWLRCGAKAWSCVQLPIRNALCTRGSSNPVSTCSRLFKHAFPSRRKPPLRNGPMP
jgi:hypothetical protein